MLFRSTTNIKMNKNVIPMTSIMTGHDLRKHKQRKRNGDIQTRTVTMCKSVVFPCLFFPFDIYSDTSVSGSFCLEGHSPVSVPLRSVREEERRSGSQNKPQGSEETALVSTHLGKSGRDPSENMAYKKVSSRSNDRRREVWEGGERQGRGRTSSEV